MIKEFMSKITDKFSTADEEKIKKGEALNRLKSSPDFRVFWDELQKRLDRYIIIEQFGFIGAPRVPDTFIQRVNAKIEANQKAMQRENEEREALASKKIIEVQAAAEAAKLEKEALSRILTPLKDAEGVQMSDGRVLEYFPTVKTVLDQRKLKELYPDVYSATLKESISRTPRIKRGEAS